MTERGGPTTQSGVFYQNTIAALYLGRLCDRRKLDRSDQVVEVRCEVPAATVDDIVVTYLDTHKAWIQAKESLETSGKPWEELWQNFHMQRHRADGFSPRDELVLNVGTYAGAFDELQETAERARGSSGPAEWLTRLTKQQLDLIIKVKGCLVSIIPPGEIDESTWQLMSQVHVEVLPLREIIRGRVPYYFPPTNCSLSMLLSLFRDKAAERSRIRRTFRADEFRSELEATGIAFSDEIKKHEQTLVTLGPGIVILIAEDSLVIHLSQWSFEIGAFLLGDRTELFAYIDRFHSLHEAFHTITCNVAGYGREITSPPRVSGPRVTVDVELSRRRSFTTLALSDDGDLAISDNGGIYEVSGKTATEQQLVYSMMQDFGSNHFARYGGSVVARLCRECSPASLPDRVKAEILRLSVFEVPSIVQVKHVNALSQDDASALRLDVEFEDVQDGRHVFHRLIRLEGAHPIGTEVANLRTVRDSRVERMLRALRQFASGADVQVSIDQLRAALHESDAEERDLQRRLENLKERRDISAWSLCDGHIHATLSEFTQSTIALVKLTP